MLRYLERSEKVVQLKLSKFGSRTIDSLEGADVVVEPVGLTIQAVTGREDDVEAPKRRVGLAIKAFDKSVYESHLKLPKRQDEVLEECRDVFACACAM
ncbi:hypothetical protein J6590_070636 [Homalodisca vitripennis]|nr:hypothetical protein J6590_070636 [Homalodisca vitripennis]